MSIAGFKVACFAARLRSIVPYVLEQSEVAEAFEIPLAAFMQGERWSYTESRHPLARFGRVPCFTHDPHRVWGLTGIILRDFTTQVLGFAPPP